ncbi:hypothetical protein BJY01DRAFT_226628, partial [Aspergillus pseudoustus]
MDFPRPLRSCTLCRQRKIKCDRQQPCGNCDRVEAQCVYPAGHGRAPKRPRKAAETRLLAQLSKLETIVKRMEGQPQSPIDTPATTLETPTDPLKPAIEQQFGRLVIDDMQSYYVSSTPWTRLGDEIEELRDLLHTTTTSEEDEGFPIMEGLGMNAAIMGYRALAHSLYVYHPPMSQLVALFEMFKTNVASLVRIFHVPTLDRIFWDAIAVMDVLDKHTEALLFAIYYSAVISMDPDQCQSLLGIPRASALETYRFAVEQALARADLLNTQNLILLQAAVLFLTALRNEDDSRAVWSLTSLVYHIAQAMGLHRDGETFGLRPLETELRRRLWWHICLLDNRSTEYHGCEPIVHECVFDTKMPLNINDTDITAEMTQPPTERDGATEMTLCLMRCEAMRVVWKIGYMAPRTKPPTSLRDPRPTPDRETLALELQTRLDNLYLKHCDPSIPFLRVASTVARLMILRMWMAVLFTQSQKDRQIRDRLFHDSIEVLQLSGFLLTDNEVQPWAWHSKTHIQWHAVAFVLADLCWRPPSAECDHAWECVNVVYDQWKTIEAERKGSMWRPIRRLIARVRYVRDIQRTNAQPTRTDCWRSGAGATAAAEEEGASSIAPAAGTYLGLDPDWERVNLATNGEGAMSFGDILGDASSIFDLTTLDLFGLLSESATFQPALSDNN